MVVHFKKVERINTTAATASPASDTRNPGPVDFEKLLADLSASSRTC
jgi:hypothetical protein